ncbi:MAG: hypothetical protein ACYCYN_13675, partial [Solirubrobacteraceae bacterium]
PWRRGRVAAPLALAVVALAGAGGTLLFATGSPVPSWFVLPANPDTGLGQIVPASASLLPIRVADPGGGPPWGMRVIETTRGEACLQGGRVVEGSLGGLGVGYAFNADGRFHPFEPADAVSSNSCATLDARGSAFQPNGPQIVTADGVSLAGENVAPSDRAKCNLPDIQDASVRCPQSELREVAMGMLGPEATSIAVEVPGQRSFTVTPYGPDGAYLIVLPAPPDANPAAAAPPAASYSPGAPESSQAKAARTAFTRATLRRARELQAQLATLHVTYRNGSGCEIPASKSSQRCPPEGIELPGPMPTSAQLASPLHVSYVAASHAGALAVDARSGTSSYPGGVGPEGVAQPALKIAFYAPVAAPNMLSAYDVELQPREVTGCSTPGQIIGEPTEEDIAQGQEVQITVPLAGGCKTSYTGRVFYARTSGSYSEVRTSAGGGEGPLYEVIGSHFGGGQHSMHFPTVGSFQFTAP